MAPPGAGQGLPVVVHTVGYVTEAQILSYQGIVFSSYILTSHYFLSPNDFFGDIGYSWESYY